MSRGLVTSSRYSPGNLTAEALEHTFVGRDELLAEVLDRVRASIGTRAKHYTLLVGPRGAGKTHFMALLRNRLLAEDHGGLLRLAALNEEEWGVASFLDFLVRILQALAQTSPGNEIEGGIEEIYRAFPTGEHEAQDVARKLLKRVVGKGTLVLLCENLGDLFEGLRDEGQKRWRSAMQEDGFWTVVATTPRLFGGVRLQTSPFYGFFNVRNLESLEFETGVQLLVRKARFEHKTELAAFLDSPVGRARARAIHHLTGGNHRAYVIMSDFITSQSLDQLVEPFMKMVDDLTPYYQDRIRQLSPFQRKLVEYLCTEATPVPVKTIASRCLASPQSTAKQIGELESLGFVKRNPVGRETLCELAEPLMRICIEVKDNRTEHFKLFVQFLRRWFSGDELRSRFDLASATAATAKARFHRVHLAAAIRDCAVHAEEPFLDALTDEVRRCWDRDDYAGVIEAVNARLPGERTAPMLAAFVAALVKVGRHGEATTELAAAVQHVPRTVELERAWANLLFNSNEPDAAVASLDAAIAVTPDQPVLWATRGQLLLNLERFEPLIENQRTLLRLNPDAVEERLLLATALLSAGRPAEAVAESRPLVTRGLALPTSAMLLAHAYWLLDDAGSALDVLDEHDEAGKANASFLSMRAQLLLSAGDYDGVIDVGNAALAVEPTNESALQSTVEALVLSGRLQEAESLFLPNLRNHPMPDDAIRLLVSAYEKRGDDAALARFSEHVLGLEPTNRVIAAQCQLLRLMDRELEAFERSSRWLDDVPDDRVVRRLRSEISTARQNYALAASDLSRIVRSEPQNWASWYKLTVAELANGDRAAAEASGLRLLDAPPFMVFFVKIAADFLSANGFPESALRLSARAMDLAPSSGQVALDHAIILMNARDYAKATMAIAHAKEIGAADVAVRPLEARIVRATSGLRAACAIIGTHAWSEDDDVASWAAEMMKGELVDRGPRALAADIEPLRDIVLRVGGADALQATLTTFLGSVVEDNGTLLADKAWPDTLPDLRRCFDGIAECALPLKMLDVAVRYVRSDETALLELPLESRSLLTDALTPQAHRAS